MNQILQMLQLQQQLNDTTNGEGWEHGVTQQGKKIDWRRCTYLECAELIESYPWKHWKNIASQPDYENIKIEVVDIWHFIMSQALMEYKINHLGTIEDIATMITKLPHFSHFHNALNPLTRDSYTNIEIVESLLETLFCHHPIEAVIDAFIEVAITSGVNLESLYQLYIGKNVLNQFRQDHGYKEGRYIKLWEGEEDNVVMQRILEQTPHITPTDLYHALEAYYPA